MDVVWEEVTKIEMVNTTSYPYKYLYDLSVDNFKTFACTSGIIVHNTLNTFHQCGTKSNVNQGVPRIRELISVSKNIKTPSAKLYLNESTKKDTENVKKLIRTVIEKVNFSVFVEEASIWYDPDPLSTTIEEDSEFVRDYYSFAQDLYNVPPEQVLSPYVLRLSISSLFVTNKNVSLYDVYLFLDRVLAKKYKVHIIYSDENADNLVFHIRLVHKDNREVELDSNVLKTTYDYRILLEIQSLLMNKLQFKGIEGIQKAIISKEMYNFLEDDKIKSDKEVILETMGSNIKQIMKEHKYFDVKRMKSNDIHEMNNTFGIEAAREVLQKEIYEVLNQSGVYVHYAHVSLLVDSMTLNGGLISMNRYGISKSDNGIFAMSSFEQPDEHFVKAAVYGISDKMNSTSSNIIFGQLCPFGTGMVDLVFDLKLFQQHAMPQQKRNVKKKESGISFVKFA